MSTQTAAILPNFNDNRFATDGPSAQEFPQLSAWKHRRAAKNSVKAYAWGFAAAAIWSGWWTVTRLGVGDGLPAADLAALRFSLAGCLMLPLAWRERRVIARAGFGPLFFLAIGSGAPYALVAGTGVRLTSAGVGGAVTVGLLPLFTLILAALMLGEKVSRSLLAGIGSIVLGAVCVALGAWHGAGSMIGLGLFVLGSMMWAGYTVALRQAALRPLTATAFVCVMSLVFYIPAWLLGSGPARVLAAAPADLLMQALYQSLLSAIGALYCFGRAVAVLGATRASVFAAIVPAFSVIIAAVVLRETPSALEIVGACLLSLGAFAAMRRPSR